MDAWLMAIDDVALAALPLAQREVVRLARDERLDEAAIADRLDIPQGIVASRLFRARMMVTAKPSVVKKPKVKKIAAAVAPIADATPLPTLHEVEKDLEGLRSLQAMLDEATHEPAPEVEESSAPSLATIRAQIEEDIPGYTAAVQAAEQQLRQAKVKLATA